MDNDAELTQTNAPVLNPQDEKQAILAAIIASTDDTIISKTLDGIITSWNPAAEKMFGYSASEAIGQHITLIIPPERFDEEAFIIGQVKKGEKVDHFETVRRAKDGSRIPISLTVSPIRNSSGAIIGASKIARDITERQKADEKQAVLSAIVTTSDDAIISKTLEGIITSWNPSAHRLFGHSEQEALGKHISLIIPPDRLSEEDVIIDNIRRGNKLNHFETIRMTKDGKMIPISVSISPIMSSSGKIIGASKIARDISEQKKIYDQLKVLNAKKDEFIGLASHELKTPLTSINGYLQILAMRMTDDKNKSFLEKTQQQVKKLSSLVEDLLDISKIEAGKLSFATEEFDICEIIEDAVDLISHANNSYHITFQPAVSSCLLTGDAHRIEQVIINLMTNAIRYSPGSDAIEIFLNEESDEIKVGVKDYGVGIAPEKLTNIFSRFYRVNEGNANVSGLGIGLYLCHEIVTRHGGKIWAESVPGEGSTFWFTVPRETAQD
ncbi:MAG: PAS domain S-box protein [Arcticibacter sp.]